MLRHGMTTCSVSLPLRRSAPASQCWAGFRPMSTGPGPGTDARPQASCSVRHASSSSRRQSNGCSGAFCRHLRPVTLSVAGWPENSWAVMGCTLTSLLIWQKSPQQQALSVTNDAISRPEMQKAGHGLRPGIDADRAGRSGLSASGGQQDARHAAQRFGLRAPATGRRSRGRQVLGPMLSLHAATPASRPLVMAAGAAPFDRDGAVVFDELDPGIAALDDGLSISSSGRSLLSFKVRAGLWQRIAPMRTHNRRPEWWTRCQDLVDLGLALPLPWTGRWALHVDPGDQAASQRGAEELGRHVLADRLGDTCGRCRGWPRPGWRARRPRRHAPRPCP